MIPRKKKICKDCGRSVYMFSGGRCKMCDSKHRYKTHIDRPNTPHKPLSRKSNGKIPPRTKSRLQEEKEYSKIISLMDKQKVIHCFFCGVKMDKAEAHHHLAGRENEMLINKKYIVHAHNSCHSSYHDLPVSKLPWWHDFLNRLSEIDEVLAYKESLKKDK